MVHKLIALVRTDLTTLGREVLPNGTPARRILLGQTRSSRLLLQSLGKLTHNFDNNNAELFHSKPEYGDTVTSIAPLNEPAGFVGGNMMDVVRQYWYDSYGNIRYPSGTSEQVSLNRSP